MPKGRLDPTLRLQAMLPLAGVADTGASAQDRDARLAAAGRVLRFVAGVLSGRRSGSTPCHQLLATAWKVKPTAAPLIRAALVLSADHELNPSSFVARCVASTGASLHDAVSAGLAALQGPRHGGVTRRAAAWLREIDGAADAARAVADRARRGDRFPGFGHPLYPAGDPRARFLMDALAKTFPRDPMQKRMRVIADAVAVQTGVPANIDYGLVSLARVLKLPAEAPILLFTLGRTVGWLAHALSSRRPAG